MVPRRPRTNKYKHEMWIFKMGYMYGSRKKKKRQRYLGGSPHNALIEFHVYFNAFFSLSLLSVCYNKICSQMWSNELFQMNVLSQMCWWSLFLSMADFYGNYMEIVHPNRIQHQKLFL